jgi:3D (Asp-Asp-Asp) domain-containing protein
MRKLKTCIQTVIVIVVLFLLASPVLITYAKNLFAENENIITIEEKEIKYDCENLLLTAGVGDILNENTAPIRTINPQERIIVETKENEELVSLGEYKLTAYCGCSKCCGKWSEFNLTASGTIPKQGRTVGCNSLKFGTEIIINGKKYVVEDTGNMKDNVIDIYFDLHEDALNFGVQYVEVFEIKK